MWTVSRATSRKVFKKGAAVCLAGAVLTLISIGGCSHPSSDASRPAPPKEKPKEAAFGNEGGSLTWSSKPPNEHPEWSIKWAKAELDISNEKVTFGRMEHVTGMIYNKSKGSSTFKADTAVADKDKNVLTLTGNVSLYEAEQNANLKCHEVRWHPDKDVIEASGDVTVITKRYSLTGVPKVLTRSDLSEVATPDMFEEKDAKKK